MSLDATIIALASEAGPAEARMRQAVAVRRIPEKAALALWKRVPIVRMLWGKYRAARKHYRENQNEWDRIFNDLPDIFQKKFLKVQGKAKDKAWFRNMELPGILDKMQSALYLSLVFEESDWTKYDRITFAGSEDTDQLYLSWHNLIHELQDGGRDIPDDALSFAWKRYGMGDVQEICALIDILLP